MPHHQHRETAKYAKVFDPRKRRIRGLWKRNGSFYAQLTITTLDGRKTVRRTRLEKDGQPVHTLAAAQAEMARLKVQREDDGLKLAPKRAPTFSEAAREYLEWLRAVKDAKRPETIRAEASLLKKFEEFAGGLRVNQISTATLQAYQANRKAEGVTGRTVNLGVIAARNVLRRTHEQGLLRTVPSVKPLKHNSKTRRLLTEQEIDRVCKAALKHCENGQQVADFVKLMAYSGGRLAETLRLRWEDVDLDRGQLHFGRDGLSNNRKTRTVDFNDRLEAHLADMHLRRPPSLELVFPSPRYSSKERATRTFNMAIRKAREAAGVPDFTPHLCRHFFASYCVMSGTDFMTVAKWLGHSDGGILIGKVYGHLAAEHTQAAARRVTFSPQVVKASR